MPEDEDPDIVRLQERIVAIRERIEAIEKAGVERTASIEKKIEGLAAKGWAVILVGLVWAVQQVLQLIKGVP